MSTTSFAFTVPKCGLFRTTQPMPGREADVPIGRLVYFHNHSDSGPPLLLLPAENKRNKWRFHDKGHLVTEQSYIASLEALRSEGLYRLREHFHPNDEQIVPSNALVQLGYNVAAEPILFFPRPSESDNAIVFPTSGIKIGASIAELLEPLDVRGPFAPEVKHLH